MNYFIQKLNKIKLPFFHPLVISVDVGTSNTRIGIVQKGTVLNEPTYVGYNANTHEYLFFGSEAKQILGKTPEFVKISRPVVNGVISDFDAEVALIKTFLDKAVNPYLSSHRIVKPNLIAITAAPYIATEIEEKALSEMLAKIGFSASYLIEKPLATAFGAGIDIFSHKPHLVADLGGGLIELSIITGGGIVVEKTLKNAGDNMNQLIAHYCYLKYGIVLGEATCEELKMNLLTFNDEKETMIVRGKSLENGLPKSVRISSGDIKEALLNNFIQIIDAMKELIEISPPEIVDDIYTTGIYLTGGLAKIKGIDTYISSELKIETALIAKPSDCTINGLTKIGAEEKYMNTLIHSK